MSPNAGLSFAEAAAQAIDEETLTGDSTSAVTEETDTLVPEEESEQPAMTKEGVLDSLTETEDESETSYEVEGEMVSVDELRKGYLRQADYTQKTQELAQQRDEHANALALWDAIRKDPVGTIQKLWNETRTNPNSMPSLEAPKSPDLNVSKLDAEVERRVDEILKNHPKIKELEQNTARSVVDEAFTLIEKEHGVTLSSKDRKVILEKAQALKTNDLDLVFSVLMAKVQRVQEAKRNVSANSTATGYRGDADLKLVSNRDHEITSFKDARDAAIEELRLEGLF